MKHPYIGLLILFMVLIGVNANADLLVFYNGAHLYGDVSVNADQTEYIFTHPHGATETFSKRQVRDHFPGIDKPASGEEVRVGDFVHSASSAVNIYDITGEITYKNTLTFPDGKEITLEVENDYTVPAIRLQRTQHGFFAQEGVHVAFRIYHEKDFTFESTHFRVSLFNYEEKLLANQEFFIRHFPPITPEGVGSRVVNLHIPSVRYEQIGRVRIVLKH